MADLVGGLHLAAGEPLRLSDAAEAFDIQFEVSAGGQLTVTPTSGEDIVFGVGLLLMGGLEVDADAQFDQDVNITGNLGVGALNVATARLKLAAGSASLVPLLLTAGVLKTVPEDGAIEYDGAAYYATIVADRQKLIREPGSTGITTLGTIGTGTWNATAIAWAKVDKAGSSLADLVTRSAGDLSSGNLAYARLPTGGGTWANGGALSITGGTVSLAEDLGLLQTKKLTLDADLDSYISKSADDVVSHFLNGIEKLQLFSNGAKCLEDMEVLGQITSTRATASNNAIMVRVTGDTFQRFLLLASGVMSWGPGGVSNQDSFLSRAAAATMRVENTLQIWKNLVVGMEAGSGFGDITQLATGKHYYDGGTDTYRTESSDNVLDDYVGGSRMLRMTGTVASLPQGWLLVGPDSVSDQGYGTTQVQVEGNAGNTSKLALRRNTANAAPPVMVMAKSRGTAYAAVTTVLNGDTLGELDFYGTDGTSFVYGASVQANVTATVGTGDLPTSLGLFTRDVGGAGVIEGFRVGHARHVGIEAAKRFYWDGVALSGDTYDEQVSANIRSFTAGAVNVARMDGNTALSDGHTNLLLNRRASGAESLQRVQWKDGASIGAGDKVMILAG